MLKFLFLLFFISPVQAQVLPFHMVLKTGDVLLQSVQCFMCSLIEIEEGGPYSHAGIYIEHATGGPIVLEAWGKVAATPLEEFVSRRKSGTLTTVMRPSLPVAKLSSLYDVYLKSFAGHAYDVDFLWDNTDLNGQKYYCSELVAKVFDAVQPNFVPTKPMHYTHYRDLWVKYFHGQAVPDGQPGVSPPDLFRNPNLKYIGQF